MQKVLFSVWFKPEHSANAASLPNGKGCRNSGDQGLRASFQGVRVSGGDLDEVEAPTEAAAETQDRLLPYDRAEEGSKSSRCGVGGKAGR